jgi:hypothetical protein
MCAGISDIGMPISEMKRPDSLSPTCVISLPCTYIKLTYTFVPHGLVGCPPCAVVLATPALRPFTHRLRSGAGAVA